MTIAAGGYTKPALRGLGSADQAVVTVGRAAVGLGGGDVNLGARIAMPRSNDGFHERDAERVTDDAWNRVVSAASETATATYTYDGLDRRVTITTGGATTNQYYSQDWQVLEEGTPTGSGSVNFSNRYVWGPAYVNDLVLRDALPTGQGATARYWAIQDANWNVAAIVLSGNVVERYDYTPFGTVTYLTGTYGSETGTSQNQTYLFQGGRLDNVSGDYSFQMRNYDPTLGRWTTVDPLGFAAKSYNVYVSFVATGDNIVSRRSRATGSRPNCG